MGGGGGGEGGERYVSLLLSEATYIAAYTAIIFSCSYQPPEGGRRCARHQQQVRVLSMLGEHSSEQHSSEQHSTEQHSTEQHSTEQHSSEEVCDVFVFC